MKDRLRVLRAEREWSQAALADRLDVSKQTVNAIETGKYNPKSAARIHDRQAVQEKHRGHLRAGGVRR